VTTAHISLILGYTIVTLLRFNLPKTNGSEGFSVTTNGIASLWTVFGGVSDLFLSCMLWFIMDDESAPDFIMDERNHYSYAILDIIKPHYSNHSSGLNSED
jgi:hypothetical protein